MKNDSIKSEMASSVSERQPFLMPKTEKVRGRREYKYRESFLISNWKLFHDALQLHHLTVAHDILPNYGICAAKFWNLILNLWIKN
jgi:hypothetical protein